ncbi:hypothetical protein AKG16_07990 [Morganella morganii]|nr:hypothetical protein AKG16_07990 [Morganella morganii]
MIFFFTYSSLLFVRLNIRLCYTLCTRKNNKPPENLIGDRDNHGNDTIIPENIYSSGAEKIQGQAGGLSAERVPDLLKTF